MKIAWIPAQVAGIVLFISGFSALCAAGQAAVDTSTVTIENAWVRAMPPTQRSTAAYMTVDNRGDTDLTIVGATAGGAARAEIHISREKDGYMSMEQLESVVLPAGQTVRMTPGGMHLMLLELDKMPPPESLVQLCLNFSTGSQQCVDAPVKKGMAGGQSHHQHH